MTALLDALAGLPVAARIALAAVFALQLALQIFALVDLARRARVAGGRKWPWALGIVFGQMLGAIVYLAVGRPAPPSAESGVRPGAADASARKAIDSLYGDRPEP